MCLRAVFCYVGAMVAVAIATFDCPRTRWSRRVGALVWRIFLHIPAFARIHEPPLTSINISLYLYACASIDLHEYQFTRM